MVDIYDKNMISINLDSSKEENNIKFNDSFFK